MCCEKCGQEFPSQFYFKENIARPICTNCFAALPPEEQQTLLAQAPAVPVNRPSHSSWRKPEFPISTLSLRENHMSAALECQVQIDMPSFGLRATRHIWVQVAGQGPRHC
jgi:hypothetical protein